MSKLEECRVLGASFAAGLLGVFLASASTLGAPEPAALGARACTAFGGLAAFSKESGSRADDIDAELARLSDRDPLVRAAAFRALAQRGGPAVLRALGEPWPTEPWARRLRVELFARAPALEAFQALGTRRGDPAAEVREAVAAALGERALLSAPAEREAWLLELLDDDSAGVRRAALKALGSVDRAESAQALALAAQRSLRCSRVEVLRTLTGLRAARPSLLDLRSKLQPADRAARIEISYALGGAALYAHAAGRLSELVDWIAVDLSAADPEIRSGGEFALRALDAELRGALEWSALDRELERLTERALHRSTPLQRLSVLRAFDPEERFANGADDVVARWRARWDDARTPEGLDALVRGGIARGLGALLRGEHAAAVQRLRETSSAIEVALLRLPADRWGGWSFDARPRGPSAAEDEGELEIDPELWDEEIARRGMERRRPIFHFDPVERDLLREDARARFTTVLAACLDPSIGLDPDAEAQRAFERLLEAYALSVAIEGHSFRAQERLPNFGENVDLVFDGETGLYELLYALARRGRVAELPAALARFAAAIEAQGPWAAREIASPSGFEHEPDQLDVESFVRYRRRNPSRFRMVWAQLLLDACGAPEEALRVYRDAMVGYGAATRDWPWAARLEAQAVQGLASCYMALRDPDAVEEALARGLARLQELRRVLEREGGPGAGNWLDADLAALYVSRAVNENVLRGRPEVGMAHMRRALELDPSDFQWVLTACYLARAGQADEARAILQRVAPQPSMAYNRGCTLALLGSSDEAFQWLATDLRENHLSAASKRQQARWAWDDPDLTELRRDPRFEALYGPRPR